MTPKLIALQCHHGGQVVELGREDFPGAGPVAKRCLRQQELKRPPGLMEDLLASETGRHRRPDVGCLVGEGQDPAGVLSGLQQAGDDPWLEIPQGARRRFKSAHILLYGRQAVAQPGPEGRHLIDGRLGQAPG